MVDDAAPKPFSAFAYLASVGAGAASGLACLVLFLAALDISGHLPPPPFTNELCKDEKLSFLRERAPEDPRVLVIGSSIALFNFSGSPIKATSSARAPLNLALCAVKMDQLEFASSYFLQRYNAADTVVLLVGPHDFERCTPGRPLFDVADVDDYVNVRSLKYYFYLKYFSPTSFVRNMRVVAKARSGGFVQDAPIAFDRFGSFPSSIERGLYYEGMFATDPKCFESLRAFARGLPPRVTNALLVICPIHPEWVRRFDPKDRQMRQFSEEVRRTLEGTRVALWDAHSELEMAPHHFSDAIHMKRAGAEHLSTELNSRLPL